MAKIYSFSNSAREQDKEKCFRFDINAQDVLNEGTNTYNEVLRILKETFSLVDISKIIRKL